MAPIVRFFLVTALAASAILPVRPLCWAMAAAEFGPMPALVWPGLNVIDGGWTARHEPLHFGPRPVPSGPCPA